MNIKTSKLLLLGVGVALLTVIWPARAHAGAWAGVSFASTDMDSTFSFGSPKQSRSFSVPVLRGGYTFEESGLGVEMQVFGSGDDTASAGPFAIYKSGVDGGVGVFFRWDELTNDWLYLLAGVSRLDINYVFDRYSVNGVNSLMNSGLTPAEIAANAENARRVTANEKVFESILTIGVGAKWVLADHYRVSIDYLAYNSHEDITLSGLLSGTRMEVKMNSFSVLLGYDF